MLFPTGHKASSYIMKAIAYLNDLMNLSEYTRTEYLEELSASLYDSLEEYTPINYDPHPTDLEDDYQIYVIANKLLYKTKSALERVLSESTNGLQREFVTEIIEKITVIHTNIKKSLENMTEEFGGYNATTS